MRSKDLIANAKKANAAALAAAFQTGDETKMTEALAAFCGDIEEAVLQQAQQEADERNQDAAIMAARGVHVLTSAEMNYYTELGKCVKSGDPKMAITNFKVAMPETVIDGVIGTIKKEHPLLDRISFVNTSYLTRFVVNATPASAATWGNITDKITKELTGALKDFNMTLLKLSVFMCISQDLVDLGPQYLDQYVRESLSESIAMALESAIVDGDGNGKPIGMTRDISETASVVGGVYPHMTAVKLDKLDPAPLGNIVAKLARDPADATKARAIDPGDLIFLCNPFDYWQKIMPATSFRRPDGTWAHDILPIPAETMQTAALESGKAVLGIASRYFAGLGATGKDGTIVQDDSVRFFEDERAYKAKLQGNARPLDAYAFVLLDISALDTNPATLVQVVAPVVTKAEG